MLEYAPLESFTGSGYKIAFQSASILLSQCDPIEEILEGCSVLCTHSD